MSVFCYGLAVGLNLLWLLLGDNLSVGAQLAVPALTAGLCGVGLLLGNQGLGPRERERRSRAALWALLLYYLAIAGALLFHGGLFHVVRAEGGAVNLEPLRTIRSFLRHYRRTGSWHSLSNLVGNVLLLIPLGVLLPALFRPMRRPWLFLPLAALAAAGIELAQWYTATGVADVDDSILNFTGAALGFFFTRLCQIFYDFYRRRRER